MSDLSIAIDESGRHGPNLMAGGHFILGSTSLTDAQAANVLAVTLGSPPQAALEWKWKYLRSVPERAEAFLAGVGPTTTLVAVLHHRFFCWSKAVDTLIYEYEYNLLGRASVARQLAMLPYAQESWEQVRTYVDPFLAAYVHACRSPGEKEFYWVSREVRRLVSRCSHAVVRERVLEPMAVGADRFRGLLLDHVAAPDPDGLAFAEPTDHIDPHVAALGVLAKGWRERLGDDRWIDALHDEILANDIVHRWTEAFTAIGRMRLSRGSSIDHARLQLADLVAGATEASLRAPSGDDRSDVVRTAARTYVGSWMPKDMTICAWRDPVSPLRPEGTLPTRDEYDW